MRELKKIMKMKHLKIIFRVLALSLGLLLLIFVSYPHIFVDFFVNTQDEEVYVEIKPFGIEKQFTSTGKPKLDIMTWSPNRKYILFSERIIEPAENSYDREWALKIINPRVFQTKTVFIGDYHLSDYEWINDNTLRVYVDSGTGVRIYRDIDVDAQRPFVAAEHASPEFWIPIKNLEEG